MAITCADDLKLVTGANVDDAHPHGDLDRIAYGDGGGSSASASPLRGYPIVCAMEEILWRYCGNWYQKDLVNGDANAAQTEEFSRSVRTTNFWKCKSALDEVTGNKNSAGYALTAVPSLAPKIVSAVGRNSALDALATFKANYASCICSSLPYLSATPPSQGDRLTTDYLAALQQSLAAFDTLATIYAPTTANLDGIATALDEDGESTGDATPNFGFFGRRGTWKGTVYEDTEPDWYYACYRGPSASATFSGFELRDGAPFAAAYLLLFVKAVLNNADGSTATKYVCYPVAYGSSNAVLGGALGVDAIKSIGSLAGFDFSMPEVSTNADSYVKYLTLSVEGSVAVVQFKAL